MSDSFRLAFPIVPLPSGISPRDKIMAVGSCFAEEMSSRLSALHFDVMENPHGILYNAASIAASLERYVDGQLYSEEDLQSGNNLWFSWDHHSRFSSESKSECLDKVNNGLSKAHEFIRDASWLLITLGSGYGWYLKETGKIVGNCHKMGASNFNKRLIPSTTATALLERAIGKIFDVNPNLTIILTLSPVRHLSDGVVENNLGKSHCLTAIHELCRKLQNVHYFPAYELMMDDLRDYRFYKEDMIHPNQQAVNYIFDKFSSYALNEDSRAFIQAYQPILDAMAHRPMRGRSEGYLQFCRSMTARLDSLKSSFPYLDLSEEYEFFNKIQG